MEWNVPEPTFLPLSLKNDCSSLLTTAIPIGTFPIGPECGFFEDWIPLTKSQSVQQERTLSASVDDHIGKDGSVGFVDLHTNAFRSIAVEKDFGDSCTFDDFNAMISGVLKEDLVKLGTKDLPGLAAIVWVMVAKVEGLGQLSEFRNKLHAPLFYESTPLHLGKHVQASKWFVGEWMSDSPTWNRGKRSLSKRMTRKPFCARRLP